MTVLKLALLRCRFFTSLVLVQSETLWSTVLANIESANGYVIPIDDDTYNTTNLNRCLLAGLLEAKLAAPKVAVLATALRAAGIECVFF